MNQTPSPRTQLRKSLEGIISFNITLKDFQTSFRNVTQGKTNEQIKQSMGALQSRGDKTFADYVTTLLRNNPEHDQIIRFISQQGAKESPDPTNSPEAANFLGNQTGAPVNQPSNLLEQGQRKTASIKTIDANTDLDAIKDVIKQNAHLIGGVYDLMDNCLATGFLISPNLFLTTGHYSIRNSSFIDTVRIRFSYTGEEKETIIEDAPSGQTQPETKKEEPESISASIPIVQANILCGGFSPEYDFAIFQLQNIPPHLESKAKKYVSFTKDSPTGSIFILSHEEKDSHTDLIIRTGEIGDSGYEEFQVLSAISTAPGVSGAPVFDSNGNVYSLHSHQDNNSNIRSSFPVKEIFYYLFNHEYDLYKKLQGIHPLLIDIQNDAAPAPICSKFNLLTLLQDPIFKEYQKGYYPNDLPDGFLDYEGRDHSVKKQIYPYIDIKQWENNINNQTIFCTEDFKEKHLYKDPAASNTAKKLENQMTAETRNYQVGRNRSIRYSSKITINENDIKDEVRNALKAINTPEEEHINRPNNKISLKNSLLFKTSKQYNISIQKIEIDNTNREIIGNPVSTKEKCWLGFNIDYTNLTQGFPNFLIKHYETNPSIFKKEIVLWKKEKIGQYLNLDVFEIDSINLQSNPNLHAFLKCYDHIKDQIDKNLPCYKGLSKDDSQRIDYLNDQLKILIDANPQPFLANPQASTTNQPFINLAYLSGLGIPIRIIQTTEPAINLATTQENTIIYDKNHNKNSIKNTDYLYVWENPLPSDPPNSLPKITAYEYKYLNNTSSNFHSLTQNPYICLAIIKHKQEVDEYMYALKSNDSYPLPPTTFSLK